MSWPIGKRTAKINQEIADAIRVKKETNPQMTGLEIIDWVRTTYKITIGSTSVNNILNNISWSKK